jgi:arylsulfatase A-like enzyme
MVGHVWAARYIAYPPTVANPEWAFLSSLFQNSRPMVRDHIPPEYLADFLPPDKTVHSSARPAMFDSGDLGPGKPPLNVLMIVMESVGARRLHLYGAPYNDTPELDALARHGVVFDRIYVSQAITSAAMAALFCSVYPYHGWFTVSRYAPDLRIPGLPAILANRGYRTAFIHSGQLFYDNNDDFLTNHGFKDLEAEHRDFDSPRDEELVGKAVDWINADRSKPFLLALWTQDTHHPYLATSNDDYHVANPSLNRELNTVHSTDALIGRLARQLDRMGLSDNTLIVVTGDHGEAFGEHGQLIHGFTVYEEESHIPLLMANPRLFPHRVDVTRVGRQIDIAPTILSILGIEAPIEWQGASLFDNDGDRRAYLFSADGNFTLGLVEGDWKFIYDFNRDSAQLYNLVTDPGEKHNLSGDPKYSAMVARDHLRLEAWLSFQNNYLARFTSADKIAKPKLQQ